MTTTTIEEEGGPSPQNAPPGKVFIQTILSVKNPTDRQEPLDSLVRLPSHSGYSAAVFPIPLADVDALGVQGGTTSDDANEVPPAFCPLESAVSSTSGPNSDKVGRVEMNSGDTEKVVIYATAQIDQSKVQLG